MKKNFIFRVAPIFFVIIMIFGAVAPASALTVSASDGEASVSESVSGVAVDTSDGFYTVKSKAVLRSSTGWLYIKLATFDKSSLVQVSGSTGDFYKVSLRMDGKKITGYIKKSELKAASEETEAKFCYTTKSAALRCAPFDSGDKTTVSKGSLLYSVGTLTNVYGNSWVCIYKDGDLRYIFSDNVKHTKNIKLTLTGHPSLIKGEEVKFKCSVSPSGIAGLEWRSSDTRIASVKNTGVVSPRAGGCVTVTASLGDLVSVSLETNVFLGVNAVFQSKNYTCSAAASLAVLRYKGKAADVKDTVLYSSIDGYVYKIVNTLNNKKYLGSETYCWDTFTSEDAYEEAIRKSLRQDCPVIVRISFPEKYFNYSSKGHYTTIVGLYEEDGKTWVVCVDSYANRYKSNRYCSKETGVVRVPLSEMYWYNSYEGRSSRYLIYNP